MLTTARFLKRNMKTTLRMSGVVVLLSLACRMSLAQSTGRWTSIGPFEAYVQSLAIDPQNPAVLYAGTSQGVFKSTDGGQAWNKMNSALDVFSLAIDPRTPSTLYASSYGVFKSTDGGETWSSASVGLPGILPTLPLVDVKALAIDPQNPDTLYAGTRTGVYKSHDGGASWQATKFGSTTFPTGPSRGFEVVNRLAIDPQQSNTIYAVGIYLMYVNGLPWGNSGGIFKSTDGGQTWNLVALPDNRGTSFPSGISAVVIDPQNPATLYASGGFPSSLLKSTDRGVSWQSISTPFSALAIAADGSNTLYGGTVRGISKSTDGGISWTAASTGLPIGTGSFLLAIDPTNGNTVYAPGGGGLFKTTDGGGNWAMMNAGVSTTVVQTLALDPQNSDSMHALMDWTPRKSTNAGSSWAPMNSVPDYSSDLLAIDPQSPETMYLGDLLIEDYPTGGVFKSGDEGQTWNYSLSGLPRYSPTRALVIDPSNPNTMYAGTEQGIFKSIDAAGNWDALPFSPTSVSALALNPQVPTTVYAAGAGGIFRSIDGGLTWTAGDFPADLTVSVLAIDPHTTSIVYAGAAGTVFKSVDAGARWSAAAAGLPANSNRVSAVIIDPQNPRTLYVATTGAPFAQCSIPCQGFNDGVFKSTDAGATWIAVNSGLTTPHVSALALDPRNSNRLYAGTIGGGIFTISFDPAQSVAGFR